MVVAPGLGRGGRALGIILRVKRLGCGGHRESGRGGKQNVAQGMSLRFSLERLCRDRARTATPNHLVTMDVIRDGNLLSAQR